MILPLEGSIFLLYVIFKPLEVVLRYRDLHIQAVKSIFCSVLRVYSSKSGISKVKMTFQN